MSLIQNPEQTFRWGRVQCLMDKTTDKKLLLALMGGRGTYCCYEYYWTRSKEKAFTDWLEYMEKCIEMANKPYANAIKWGWDNDRMHDEETDDEETEEVRRCWTCDTRPATHRTYRDALEDYELTCDECHKDEYPEEYECDEEKKEYNGVMLPKFVNGREVIAYPNAGISPMIATADSRAHEIISHRAKYGNAPLFENNIVFGNFFSREQFEEECDAEAIDYFDEFQEHIHRLGREGYFNELMKEYFEEWLETNR